MHQIYKKFVRIWFKHSSEQNVFLDQKERDTRYNSSLVGSARLAADSWQDCHLAIFKAKLNHLIFVNSCFNF